MTVSELYNYAVQDQLEDLPIELIGISKWFCILLESEVIYS